MPVLKYKLRGVAIRIWPGSLPIISQYLSTNQAVRWGQCWVFSGLLTSLGRAIGIPTRSVTNFESAHDRKPFDNFVTKHWTYSVAGTWQHNSEYDKDSVWNFHVRKLATVVHRESSSSTKHRDTAS